MPKLDQAIADAVDRDGLPRQATAEDGSVHVLYLEANVVRSMLARAWQPPLPSDPTPIESDRAIAAREVAAQQETAAAAALRQRVLTVAQGAVGKSIDTLAAGEVRALVVCLLYRAGGIDRAGVVQPLDSWL